MDEKISSLNILYHQPGHLKGINVLKKIDNYIFSGGGDGRICIWDLELIEELVCLYAHNSPIIDIIKLNNENIFVSCSKDLEIKLWDLSEFKLINQVKAHSSALIGVYTWKEFLFSAGHDQFIKKWIVDDNTLIEKDKIKIPDLERFFILNNYIYASLNNGLIVLLDPENFKIEKRIYIYSSKLIKSIKKSSKYLKPFHKKDPYTILFNMTRKYGIPATVSKEETNRLIFGHQFGLVSIWKKSKTKIKQLLFIHNKHITGLEKSGENLITTSLDATINAFNLSTNNQVISVRFHNRPLSLLKINNRFIVGLETGEMVILNDNLEIEKHIDKIVPVTSACITPKFFAIGNIKGEVFLLDIKNLKLKNKKSVGKKAIIAMFYDKRRLIIVSEDRMINILNDELQITKSFSLDFVPTNPQKVKRYIILTPNYVFDLEKDQIIKGEVSKQTEGELENYKLLSHEFNRGDVSLIINENILQKNLEELSLFYEKEIIDTVRNLSETFETEKYRRRYLTTIFSKKNNS